MSPYCKVQSHADPNQIRYTLKVQGQRAAEQVRCPDVLVFICLGPNGINTIDKMILKMIDFVNIVH